MRSVLDDGVCCTDKQAAEEVYPSPLSKEALIRRAVAEH